MIKAPNDELDYGRNWSVELNAGDTIATSDWDTHEPDDATGWITVMGSPAASFTDTATTVWLTGGTAGERYIVTNTIATAAGRTYVRNLETIYVKDRR